jgi:hypothetical protein
MGGCVPWFYDLVFLLCWRWGFILAVMDVPCERNWCFWRLQASYVPILGVLLDSLKKRSLSPFSGLRLCRKVMGWSTQGLLDLLANTGPIGSVGNLKRTYFFPSSFYHLLALSLNIALLPKY